ncbi:hypothetical protein COX85_00445 [Candidatus Micrarchaeota archaeon CG_4_10_14_0_2_um_filter_55_9]|nr:MAG: hypothetical protein AUJ15_01540 [Candidatus Micrarchaeota archaeon CG1_02_55_41]PIO02595.1 MAG: hypothetical protein COT57_03200 [Candidatus Micrarchaeota archaeon CG09_land_8_20_14_0_10_55_25]PIZ92082.1 MAG: hypothetical protein COX85_00445 [Candidatus Micrarchaeota archaeon CG_4_10_14_0_2_um_filter_55_9]
MGLLDYLKRKVGPLKETGGGQSEAVAEPAAIRLGLEEVERFLAEREREEFGEAIEKARDPIERLENEVMELRQGIEGFSRKEPDSGHRFYKIASQMKQGFDSRSAKLFVSLGFPGFAKGKKPSFLEVTEFQERLLKDLQTFSKTALDNKYLPEFFKDDTAEFSLLAKRISALAVELDAALAPARKRQLVFSGCRKALEKVSSSKARVNELEEGLGYSRERVGEAGKNAEACKKRMAELGERGAGANQELVELRARKNRLFAELMRPLSVLRRPFRKLERVCPDKELKKIFRDYSSNPWNSLLSDSVPDAPRLRKACKFLLESGEELEKDEKVLGKIRSAAESVAGGACSPLLADLEELNQQEKELEKDAAPLIEARKNQEIAGKELEALKKQLEGDGEALKQRRKELKAAELELAEKLSGLAGAKVALA